MFSPFALSRLYSPYRWAGLLILAFLVLAIVFNLAKPAAGQGSATLVVVVSAASFAPDAPVAPESMVAAFGLKLATATVIANSLPLPKTLAGTTVKVNGEAAQLFFVSAGQINFLVPASVSAGEADIVVTSGDGATSTGKVRIAQVAPALLTADASGRGPLASQLFRIKKNGQQSYEPLSKFDGGKFSTVPINLGDEGDLLFLALYLTGIRRAAASDVRVSIGGVDFPAQAIAPVGGFAGLDQVNVALPRSFAGRGRIKLLAKADGYSASNEGEIEVGGVANNSPALQITSSIDAPVLVGDVLELAGEGFAANPQENLVQIVGAEGEPSKADVLAVTGTSLRLRVGFGAATGRLRVICGQREASIPIKVRTSVSGFVEEVQRQPDGTDLHIPIPGAMVRMKGEPPIERLTGADGSFVLPDTPTEDQVIEIIPPETGGISYPPGRKKIYVLADRDNQYNRPQELARAGDTPFPPQTASADEPPSVSLAPQAPSAMLTFLLPGRTPANLQAGHFSTAIAQITPFGQPISPAARLSFQNRDAIPAGEKPRLFKFDQNLNSPTLGQFIDIGEATVSADGQRVETAPGAITEGSYYFASLKRATAAINGRVVERNGRPVPRAIVQARGQSTFTDGYGGFVLRDVPVMRAEGDSVTVEVSYQRPDGSVSRKAGEPVEITADRLATIRSEIVLDAATASFPPVILAPASLNLSVGETREFDFAVAGSDSSAPRVSLGGSATAFTTLTDGQGTYRLRMSPAAEGEFTLKITAANAAGSSAQDLTIGVAGIENSAPTALGQSVATPEDTPRQITLAGRDPNARTLVYSIVNLPSRGSLSGAPPNVAYLPGPDFNGVDSFDFKVSNGIAESRLAKVSVVVSPVNDSPVLSVTGLREVNAGETLNLIVSATDADAQPLTLSAAGKPAEATVTELASTSWQFSWTPLAFQAGSYKLNFKVEDNGSPRMSDTREFAFSVKAPDLTKSKWAKTYALEGGSINHLLASGSNLFAATPGGGVYLSTNQGQSWAPVNNGLGNLWVNALARNGDRLFAGTLNGIFTSDNNGRTWQLSGFANLSASRLVAANGKVYAWTSSAEWYSVDNGASWKRLRPDLPVFNGNIYDYGIVVANDGTIYARGGIGPPYTQVLLRLRSGEQTWQRIEASLPSTALTGFETQGLITFGKTLVYSFQEYSQQNYKMRWFLSFDQGNVWEEINPAQGSYSGQTQSLFVFQGKIFLSMSYDGLVSSTDNGHSWQRENVGSSNFSTSVKNMISIGSTLFAGLAGYYYSQDDGVGIGVYRSIDGGKNWSEVNTGLTNGGSIPMLLTSEMDIYAPASWNLLTSDKQGQSWRKLDQKLPQSLRLYQGGTYRSGIAAGGKTLLACCGSQYVNGSYRNFLYLSTDSGQNWNEIDSKLLNLEDIPSALAVTEANLYAGGVAEVAVSKDAGRTWQVVRDGLPINRAVTNLLVDDADVYAITYGAGPASLLSGIYLLANQGKSWVDIGPKETIEDKALTTFTASGARLFAGTDGGLVYVSLDQGQNWKVFDSGLPKERLLNLVINDGTVYAATRSGVFFSNDNGQSWKPFMVGLTDPRITSLVKRDGLLFASTEGGSIFRLEANVQNWSESNAGLANTFTNAIAFSSNNLFAGSLGSGVFRSSNGGRTWTPSGTGLPANANVSSFATSPANEATIWAGLFDIGVYRSDDQGASWTAFNAGLGNRLVNKLFINGPALYAGTDGGVFRSVDGGNWSAINTGLSTLRVVSFIADGSTLYAGTDGGGVFKLAAGSEGWTRVSTGLANQSVTALLVNNGVIYAGTSGGGICISRNGGENWTAANNQLPPMLNVYAFAVSGRKVYAGGIYGVFVTEDEGQNWKQVNAGLLDVYVTGLAVSGNTLFAGTARGGVFTSPIP